VYILPVFEGDDDSLKRNIGETVSFKRCIVDNLVECECSRSRSASTRGIARYRRTLAKNRCIKCMHSLCMLTTYETLRKALDKRGNVQRRTL
jgi:hypothetical protein